MRRMVRRSGWMVVGLLPVLASAQAGKLEIPDFTELAQKATDSVDITLNGDMLKSATYLMGAAGGRNSGDTDLSSLVAGLKAITVRSFTFDKPDMYSQQAVDGVLAQVDVPGWQKVISVREKGERVEIHMRQNTEDGGLLIVTEEPKELTIVNIAGKINMDQLRQLQGHLGVPNMPGIVGGAAPAAPPAPAAQQVVAASQSAAWVPRKLLNFGTLGTASCEDLDNKLTFVLLQLGARASDLHVDQRDCVAQHPGGLRSVDATFSVLMPADQTGSNARGALVEARWQTVELRVGSARRGDSGTVLGLGLEGCAYLKYVTEKVLPLFSTRDVKAIPKAVCEATDVGLRAEVLGVPP